MEPSNSPASPDHRVRDLAETVLTLRPDLTLTPRSDGDEPGYLVEDKVNSKFFRIGLPEYAFVSLLDGKTAVREAVGIAARVEPEHALTEGQAATVCNWLLENELAFTSESASAAGVKASQQRPTNRAPVTRWNPLFLRIPLFKPDWLLGRLLPWTSWLLGWPGAVLTTVLAMFAGYQVLTNWHRLTAASNGIVSANQWIWISVSWLVVKALHELAHGIVCKRYGGSVREGGVVLILAAPVAYMDVTSTWRFRSKWQRIHVAAAGMQVELLIAAVAGLVWCHARPGMLSEICLRVMVLASVTTVLFNANPLMRFDGYYILSDLLELPNLYTEGQQLLRHWARKWFWGLPSTVNWSWGRGSITAVYGIASLCWRTAVSVMIALAAATALQGAGIVLAVIGVGLWTIPPLARNLKFFFFGSPSEAPRRLRFLLSCTATLVTAYVLLICLRWPGVYRAPAIVEYEPAAVVRTSAAGFVDKICVVSGQMVQRDQVLAVLRNESLQGQVRDLEIQIRQAESRVRALRYDGEMAAMQANEEQLKSLRQQLAEKAELEAGLTLRAPEDGRVVSHDLAALLGTYLPQGTKLMVIGFENRKQLLLSIAQRDLDAFGNTDQSVWVRVPGRPGFATQLSDISPRASKELPNEALATPLGGALMVRALQADNDEMNVRYELLSPRFDGHIALSEHLSRALFAGQRGFVTLRAYDRSIASYLSGRISDWVKERSGHLRQLM